VDRQWSDPIEITAATKPSTNKNSKLSENIQNSENKPSAG